MAADAPRWREPQKRTSRQSPFFQLRRCDSRSAETDSHKSRASQACDSGGGGGGGVAVCGGAVNQNHNAS